MPARVAIDRTAVEQLPAEDLALMLFVAEDETSVRTLMAAPEFDRTGFNELLTSIGIAQ